MRSESFALGLLAVLYLARTASAIDFPAHPGVVLNRSEIAVLRAQLGVAPAEGSARPLAWKQELYRSTPTAGLMHAGRGTRPNAEMWLGREIVIPARGGHYHHFFCDDGDRLEIPSDQKFAPGPYRCSRCGRSYDGEKYEAAVRRLVHSWLSQAAWDLAMVSALEDRADCAARSAEILLKYAEAYPGPHTSRTEGGMVYQSLDESMWVIPLAHAYDLIHGTLTARQRERIEEFLRITASGIRQCGAQTNWGSWHLSAVGVVGFAIHDKELVDWALQEFRRQIREELGDDGLWPESVHTYHYFPLLAFTYLAEAAGHAGIDLFGWEAAPGKSLTRMFAAPLDYAYPDFRLPAINDGWFESFVPADIYELAWHRTRRPEFAWVIANGYSRGAPAGTVHGRQAGRRGGLYAFLFGGDIPENPPSSPRTSVNFPVLGICMLRSPGGAMMSFDYGPFLGHGQFDKLGVTLFAGGRLWIADYGTPGYGSPILPWYLSTAAHNTVVVDGQSQRRTRENAAQLWLGDDELEGARSVTAEAYPGVTHARTVLRTPEYFVVVDELTGEQSHVYDLCWRGEGVLELAGEALDRSHPGKLDGHITEVAAGAARPDLQGAWREGEAGLAFAITSDAPLIPIAGKCPAETGSRRIPLLICRHEGATAMFATVLMPFRGTGGVEVRLQNEAVIVSTGHFTDTIQLPHGEDKPRLSRDARK